MNKQIILYVCLISPLLFSIVRKTWPGQPAWIEGMSLLIIFFFFILSYKNIFAIDRYIRGSLFSIILIYAMFIIPSLFVDLRIGLAAFFTRIVPIFLVVIFYKNIVNINQINNISKMFAWISVLLLPIAILGILFGNSFLNQIFS